MDEGLEEMDNEQLAALNGFEEGQSQKTPANWLEEEDEAVLGEPDLAEYFAQWELNDPAVIAICRTYANYLAAKTRPKKYLKNVHGTHATSVRDNKGSHYSGMRDD